MKPITGEELMDLACDVAESINKSEKPKKPIVNMRWKDSSEFRRRYVARCADAINKRMGALRKAKA